MKSAARRGFLSSLGLNKRAWKFAGENFNSMKEISTCILNQILLKFAAKGPLNP